MSNGGEIVGVVVVGAAMLGDATLLWRFKSRSARRRARRFAGDLTVVAGLAVLGVRGALLRPDAPRIDALVALVGLGIAVAMLPGAMRALAVLRADRMHPGERHHAERRDQGALRLAAWVWLAVLVAYAVARG